MYIFQDSALAHTKKRSEIECRKVWTITSNEHTVESNIFRKGEREWEVGRESQNTREQGEEQKNECMHDKNYPIACDWCVHECDS